jgi:Family of unknown function (DUF5995)
MSTLLEVDGRSVNDSRWHPAPCICRSRRVKGAVTGELDLRPAVRITEVIARLRNLVAALPPGDGVRAFTTLYLAVTEAVQDAAQPGEFEDAPFVRWLDVVFANLYFEALRGGLLAAGSAPKAWAPLVEARGRTGVVSLQFALAGMNAHVNRDLPVALVQTWEGRKLEPRRDSPQLRDFRKLNGLLAEVEEQVKAELVTDALRDFDVALGDLDDVLAMWKLARARDAAWTNAETLWALRGLPVLRDEFLGSLDRLVGFAGRGLLRPLSL